MRLFGSIINYSFEFWVGTTDGHHACFGDNYFFTLEQMCMVVDELDTWRKHYKDALGDVILEWFDYYSDINHYEERNPDGHPTINFYSWLLGTRPEILKT